MSPPIISTRLEMCWRRKGSSLYIGGDVCFVTLGVTVKRGDCCAGATRKYCTSIFDWIFSMFFSGFIAREPKSTPMAPIVALTEFFYANIYQLSRSWYFYSNSVW